MDEGADVTKAHAAVDTEEAPKIDLIIRIEQEAIVTQKKILMITEEEVKIIPLEGSEDNGMVKTLITMTGLIEIEILKVKAI